MRVVCVHVACRSPPLPGIGTLRRRGRQIIRGGPTFAAGNPRVIRTSARMKRGLPAETLDSLNDKEVIE